MSLFAMKKRNGHTGAKGRCPSHPRGSPRKQAVVFTREKEQITAARSLVKELREEMACPICLEYFVEPVILDCGHNFCQACLTQCWGETERAPSCPQCREASQQENFRPNRQLANLVELVKKLQAGKGAEGKWGGCERHQEPLKLFCQDDQVPICVVCDRSLGHQNHSVLPMEEAFLVYKKVIQAELQCLAYKREELKDEKKRKDQRSQEFLAQLESEKQMTKSAFQKIRDFLERREHQRLSKLEIMKGEVEKTDKENQARFLEESSDLSHRITELEGRFQQPEAIFVQDPKTTLNRHEKKPERQLVEIPPILEQRLRIYSDQTSALQKALKESEESLAKTLVDALTKVNVTLDPETAHPHLLLPADLKSVTVGQTAQNLPKNPERFDTLWCVLGCEKFTSGRSWWEVDMGTTQSLWAVGVARESVERKGNTIRNPDAGFWILQTQRSQTFNFHHGHSVSHWRLSALTSSQSVAVSERVPQKIRVVLDYEEGLVEFFCAATNVRLFAFPPASFSGEVLRPYFNIGQGSTLKC
ncbi:zinc finger protein RFP-like [Paroedura picta]|uniref:zinc finger protein RFP-like n=1 Tax=Paroedura picta TaxID=143630 RepID=UPI004057CADB